MAKTQAKQLMACIDHEGYAASLREAKMQEIVITVTASRPDPLFLHRIEQVRATVCAGRRVGLEDLETE